MFSSRVSESIGVIYGNSCEQRCMMQLGLSAAEMATIASVDSVSFIHAVWGHIDIRSIFKIGSKTEWCHQVVRLYVHISYLCYKARRLCGINCPKTGNSLVTSIYYNHLARGISVEIFWLTPRISAWFEIRFPFQILLLLPCPTGS